MRTKIILMGVLALCLVSCNIFGPKKNDSLTLQIQGVVSDAADGAPISNALVTLWKMEERENLYDQDERLDSFTTGPDGRYHLESKIEGCKERYLSLHAHCDEFYSHESVYYYDDPHVNCTNALQIIDIKIERY